MKIKPKKSYAIYLEKARIRNRKYYEKNREAMRQRGRKYSSEHREEIRAKCRKYYWEHRKKLLSQSKEWRRSHKEQAKFNQRKDPIKYRARKRLKEATYRGKIKRGPCVKCGRTKVHGHHPNYNKPFEVIWLCPKHHAEVHRLSLDKLSDLSSVL
jgi:hypothetical protein